LNISGRKIKGGDGIMGDSPEWETFITKRGKSGFYRERPSFFHRRREGERLARRKRVFVFCRVSWTRRKRKRGWLWERS